MEWKCTSPFGFSLKTFLPPRKPQQRNLRDLAWEKKNRKEMLLLCNINFPPWMFTSFFLSSNSGLKGRAERLWFNFFQRLNTEFFSQAEFYLKLLKRDVPPFWNWTILYFSSGVVRRKASPGPTLLFGFCLLWRRVEEKKVIWKLH